MVDWLNQNANRSYPFIHQPDGFGLVNIYSASDTLDWLDSLILDAGVIFGVDAEFDYSQHHLFLKNVLHSVGSGHMFFDFRATAPSFGDWSSTSPGNYRFMFVVDTADFTNDFTTVWKPAAEIDDLAYDLDETPHLGTMFVTFGNLTYLADAAPSGKAWKTVGNPDTFIVEPGNVQTLDKGYAKTVNIANRKRLTIPGCVNSSSSSSSSSSGTGCPVPEEADNIPYKSPTFTGDIELVEGYNCTIETNEAINTITVDSRLGAGDGQVCGSDEIHGEIPITLEEECKLGLGLNLSGGPLCDELLYHINGVLANEQGELNLVGDGPVSIVPNPEEHKVIIKLQCDSMLACHELV